VCTSFARSGGCGRPGFVDLLREIARVWREERPKVFAASTVVVDRLAALQSNDADTGVGAGAIPRLDAPVSTAARAGGAAAAIPRLVALVSAADECAGTFDRRFGGFGGAPKFPRPSELLLLLRARVATRAGAPRH